MTNTIKGTDDPKLMAAFPFVIQAGENITVVTGMTLRDYFAAKASVEMFKFCVTESEFETQAKRCFLIADAMLKAR